jgi:hypothetical protein
MNIQAINTAIISGQFTAQDLDAINDAVRFAKDKLARVNSVTLKSGTRVFLNHSKVGGKAFGTILKVKIKKADVKMDWGATYSVPLSMLTVA